MVCVGMGWLSRARESWSSKDLWNFVLLSFSCLWGIEMNDTISLHKFEKIQEEGELERAGLIFTCYFGTWKGGKGEGESESERDRETEGSLAEVGPAPEPQRWGVGGGAHCLAPWLSVPGRAWCDLLWMFHHLGPMGGRVENGAQPWLLCQLGLAGDTCQPAWVICLFTAKGLLTRCSLQTFKLLDSKVSPGHSGSLFFHKVSAANFTFFNYEEKVVGTLIHMGVRVITISEPVLSSSSSLPSSISFSSLLSSFWNMSIPRSKTEPSGLARLCHPASRGRRRCPVWTSFPC